MIGLVYRLQHRLCWLALCILSLALAALPNNVLLTSTNFSECKRVPERILKGRWAEADVERFRVGSLGSDGELIDATNHFFWNKPCGIALELGAVNGVALSETKLLTLFGWKRILVEANPIFIPKLREQKDSAVIHAAICNESGKVLHYFNHRHESGIVEFSSSMRFSRAEKMKHITPVSCLPLSLVFEDLKVTHINFFVLDVEGAELSILESIDWSRVIFDVITVETEKAFRRVGYAEDVAAYLLSKGYVEVPHVPGRNSWFRRLDFIPSRRPSISAGCFNGALWSMIFRHRNHSQQNYFEQCPQGYFTNNKCQNCRMLHG